MSPPRDNGGMHGFGHAKRDANEYASLAPFLKRIDQHIVWREEPRATKTGEMKPTKVPYSVHPRVKVRAGEGYSIAPRCWASASLAANVVKISAMHYAGIGVVFGPVPETDEFIWGIDLDNCFNLDGTPRTWAVPIITLLIGTYLEMSPSGGGIKAFIRGKIDQFDAIATALGVHGYSRIVTFARSEGNQKAQQVEIYLGKRFFAETGLHCAESAANVEILDLKTFAKIGSLLPTRETETPDLDTNTPPASLDELASAVAVISPDKPVIIDGNELTAREVWLKIGMGLHHATDGGAAGFAIWRDWSSASPEFDSAKLVKLWKGFKRDDDANPVTAGTIFKIAATFGFVREYRVPASSKLFAGMTMAELLKDICFVTMGDWWWSHSRCVAMTMTGLNNALSGLRRPTIKRMNNQPATFTAWLQATSSVAAYTHFVRRGGQPPICETETGAGDEAINTWRPLPPVPEEILERVRREGAGAVPYWIDITHDLCNGNKEQVELLLDWAAAVVMEPSRKPGWSIILFSLLQGIGKDMWSYGLARALGARSYTVINRKTLERDFNAYLEYRLIHVSDLRSTTRGTITLVDIYNILKQVTSNFPPYIEVNQKYEPARNVDNLSGWIISTNEPAPVALSQEDRRWAVFEGRGTKRKNAFYAGADPWIKTAPDTGDVIRAFLQLRWESMSDARRAVIWGIAPETEAKMWMIDVGRSPVEAAIKSAIDDLDGDGWSDLMRLDDVIEKLHMLQMSGRFPGSTTIPNKFALALLLKNTFKALQVPVGRDGNPMPAKLPDQSTTRIYAMRRVDTYRGLTPTKIGELYAKQAAAARARGRAGAKY